MIGKTQSHKPYEQRDRINPYSPNPNTDGFGTATFPKSTLKTKKYTITSNLIKNVFNKISIDGKFLNKTRFNDALSKLFGTFQIPVCYYTHLSDKLFEVFDENNNNKLNEEQFYNCIKNILTDRNYRIKVSMLAMMKIPNLISDTVSVEDIKIFFFKSFVEGYKFLVYIVNKNPETFKAQNLPVVTVSQIEQWALSFENQIKIGVEKDLKHFDGSIVDNVTFEQYKKWIHNDHVLYLRYGNKKIMVATSLIPIGEVGFSE